MLCCTGTRQRKWNYEIVREPASKWILKYFSKSAKYKTHHSTVIIILWQLMQRCANCKLDISLIMCKYVLNEFKSDERIGRGSDKQRRSFSEK